MSHLQSIIHPAGIQAARVSHLWWVMFWICAVVWAAVAVAALVAIARGRRGSSTATDAQIGRSVTVAGGLSVAALLGLLFQSIVTGRALDTLRSPDALRIQVTGNQWWWDVQYEHDEVDSTSTGHRPEERDARARRHRSGRQRHRGVPVHAPMSLLKPTNVKVHHAPSHLCGHSRLVDSSGLQASLSE